MRLAVNRRRQQQETAEPSLPLPQLIGEQSFAANFDRAWRRDRRSQTPLSLLVINVDHLASYNRERGRAAGDHCLRRIGAVLYESIYRPDDLVAHRGGGEFVVLLPATDSAGAAVVAERLRAKVASLALTTVSIGMATAHPLVDPSPEDLMAAAERALSKAKLEGRNRLEIEQNVAFSAPA